MVFFPDVSSWQSGLTITPGTVAVIAKASEGADYVDPAYATFKAQAVGAGAIFSAYHFLHQGNVVAQADHAFAVVGAGAPLMLDVEPLPSTTSIPGGSRPTVIDVEQFIARYRQLGGRVWGVYFPRWYWSEVGGDLSGLDTALIASGYPPTGYSDTDVNWSPYGGKTPDVWQYTNRQPYGGQPVDFNAFRGTVQELADLIQGGSPVATFPQPDVSGMAPAGVNLAGKFVAGQPVDGDHAAFYADVRSEIAVQLLEQVLTALKTPAVAAPAVDVDALAAALAPHLTAGATADQLAHAVVMHLGADLQAG